MLVVGRGLVLAVALALVEMASASDALYRCSDGTFTNRVERQCAPYDSTGVVRGQGATGKESKNKESSEELTQPFGQVKVLEMKGDAKLQ
jgi:hypothetical protein